MLDEFAETRIEEVAFALFLESEPRHDPADLLSEARKEALRRDEGQKAFPPTGCDLH